MKLKSDWLFLDVKGGRKKLKKLVEKGGKVRVIIEATINHISSHDDGVSREFAARVNALEVRP